VGGDHPDGVPPALGVPAGQPVGAHAGLQRWQPGHQRDEDDDAVAGEKPGDSARVGQPIAETVHRRGVMPPQPDRGEAAGRDHGQHGVGMRAG